KVADKCRRHQVAAERANSEHREKQQRQPGSWIARLTERKPAEHPEHETEHRTHDPDEYRETRGGLRRRQIQIGMVTVESRSNTDTECRKCVRELVQDRH